MTIQSQNKKVLAHLKSGKSLTQLQTARWQNPILRLGARVFDLRGMEYKIKTIPERNKRFGSHARYLLSL